MMHHMGKEHVTSLMMIGKGNYITIIRLYGTELSRLICKVSWHALWTLRFSGTISRKDFISVYSIVLTKMGGDKKRVELDSFEMHIRNTKAWKKIKSGGLLPFLEKLHGSNQEATKHFEKKWKNGELTLFGRKVEINENLIAEVSGMSTDGHIFFRDRVFSDEVVIKFPKKEKERMKLVKISNSYFKVDTIKAL